ncbi:MAG: hypothetical protein R2834_19490 [Rhodothermales bacterium]
MNIILFGATGMVGQGVLQECLRAGDVDRVVTVGRQPTGRSHAKLREIAHPDLLDLSPVTTQLEEYDACFYCLGASAIGLDEAGYTRINHDMPVHAGALLGRLNPGMTFIYVSGQGTGNAAAMWSRVKGKTEQDLLAMPFKAAYMFRPGVIQPVDGVRSRTAWYNGLYAVFAPVVWLARKVAPGYILNSKEVGLAMLEAARNGAPKRILEPPDIRALAMQA